LPSAHAKTTTLLLQGTALIAIAGYTLASGAAWFGGDLVYDQRIGVTHAVVDEPESFTPTPAWMVYYFVDRAHVNGNPLVRTYR
jgi:hypothetical protein